jgi:hypothetical protein
MRFEVLSGNTVIGWSEFELGDPPMGVAYGRFYPSELYDSSQHVGPDAGLRVRPEGHQQVLEPSEGVCIEDRSADFGSEGIEVSILGLGSEVYSRVFPHHVKTYVDQLRSR